MKRTHLAPVLAALLLVLPAASQAKSRPPGYLAVKGGGYFPQHGDLEGFDGGLLLEVAYGRHVTPGFAVEGSVGYFRSESDSLLPAGADEVSALPVLLTVKGVAPFGTVEGYGLAGAGVYFVETKGPLGGSDDDTVVGFHLGAGGNVFLSEGFFLGAELKYLFLEANRLGQDLRLDGFAFTANAGFRF